MPSIIQNRNYFFIGIISICILAVMGYSFFTSHFMINKYSPLVDATMEIKFEATTAHLWFEEKISGDRYESFESIISHIDEAIWYANAMLEGGENPEGKFYKLKDPTLRDGISKSLKMLDEFKKITQIRYQAIETSGIGTQIDQKYDGLFKNLLKHVDQVETLLQSKIRNDYANYKTIQIFLLIVVACLSLFLLYVQFDHDRTLMKKMLELNQAKKQAEKNETWLKTTMNSMGDAVIITDHSGQITYMNPVATSLTGWLLKDARDKHVTEIFHIINEFTKEPVENPIKEVIQKNVVVGLANHTELISKTGEVWPISDSAAPIFDNERNLQGVVIVFHEITEQKKAEAEKERLESHLRQALKMEAIGTLAGGIAHDFNNILAMILGNAELAKDEIPEDSLANDNIQGILSAGLRAKNLVQQILSFSRREEVKKEPLSLTEMVQDCMQSLHQTIPTSIEQVLCIDENILSEQNDIIIISDVTQIHQLILNICVNAVHAMDEKGKLTVGVERVTFEDERICDQTKIRPGTYGHLFISDTGPGIDKRVLKRIFDPFYTTKEVGQGSGMGLAVVHGIVEDHGGQIVVESSPGKGASFHIYFPVTDKRPAMITNDAGQSIGGHEKILLVDDEPNLLDVGKKMLTRYGYNVTAESDSSTALQMIENDSEKFDLVITDQTMPKVTGSELAETVLRIRPDLPIILCTGHSTKIDKTKAKKIGIRAFVAKPLQKNELLMLIRKVLDKK